jgi:hypothetical protein
MFLLFPFLQEIGNIELEHIIELEGFLNPSEQQRQQTSAAAPICCSLRSSTWNSTRLAAAAATAHGLQYCWS